MTDTSATPPAASADAEPESLVHRIEDKIEGVLHDAEHDEEVVEPVVDKVATDAADVAAVADPALVPAIDDAEAIASDVNAEVQKLDPPVTTGLVVDSSVTQGNRLVPAESLVPETPLNLLTNKIKAHFAEGSTIVSDLRAAADKLETELNKLRTGL